jgi:5,10-methylenetetrahydromethanopterin reductase
MPVPKFGLNRFDESSVAAFADDVKWAESLGWDIAFIGDSQLRHRDMYILLAAAAQATERIEVGQLVTNPVTRHPTVIASSTATIEELAPGRTMLGIGVGDTAVRLAGLKLAKVSELESAIKLIKGLLAGEEIEVGALRPAYLPFHHEVPVWVTASGARALKMAGGVADGIFLRIGTSKTRIDATLETIREGATAAGRDPNTVRIGIMIEAVLWDDPDEALLMAKSVAAGFYEQSPELFNAVGLAWQGPGPEELKREHNIWPDFHHNKDLIASGKLVNFLPREAADLFVLWGPPSQIVEQLVSLVKSSPVPIDYVVLRPLPDPKLPDRSDRSYAARMAKEVLPAVREALK